MQSQAARGCYIVSRGDTLMRTIFRRSLVTFLILLISLFNGVAIASAEKLENGFGSDVVQKPLNARTKLTMDPLQPINIGDHPVLVLHLTSEFDRPIHGQPILIF